MTCDVILTRKNNKYIARVKDWPEVIAEERTRDAAIRKIKKNLHNYLTKQVEIVKIEVPLPNETGNPWLDKFGWFKDDPTWGELFDEIERQRDINRIK